METEAVKYLLGLGVGGVIAYIIFVHYSKASADWRAERREMHEKEERRSDVLILTLKENTAAFTNVMRTTEALHRRLDHELRHHRGNDRLRIAEGGQDGG